MTPLTRSTTPLAAALVALTWTATAPAADSPSTIPADAVSCTTIKVVDGDTLRLTCGGSPFLARLHCIDAPELAQGDYGTAAQHNLARMTPLHPMIIETDSDNFGRSVARVFDPATKTDLSLRQVQDGKAAVYRRYCDESQFDQAETIAKAHSFGIWETPGCQQTPWLFRSKRCADPRP